VKAEFEMRNVKWKASRSTDAAGQLSTNLSRLPSPGSALGHLQRTTAALRGLIALLVLLLAVLTTSLASAQDKLLRWGADTDSNAPYGFYGADNKLTGFEYDIIQALAEEMGRKPVFVQNDWDGLIGPWPRHV